MKIPEVITNFVWCTIVAIGFYGHPSVLHADAVWPPQLNKLYPEMEFIDQAGDKLKLSDFKGKVIVVEYVGMNCPACQSLSGADNPKIGPFEGNDTQKGLWTLDESFKYYTSGISLFDDRIVFIQILLYDMKMGAPTPDDAKRWAKHFGFSKAKHRYVAVPPWDLRNNDSYNLIPGCHLVDKNLILRADSAGHSPKHNFQTYFLPMVPELLKE